MIACLLIPYFAAGIERRDDRSLTDTPLVVGGQAWEPHPLYAFSREAARRGVQPGMSLRLAHTLLPQAHFMPASPPRYQDGAGEVTDILSLFTPLVMPEALWEPTVTPRALQQGRSAVARSLPARYTVDLEGLPEREALPLAQEMGRTVRREAQLEPAVGLAAQPFTAQVAAARARPGRLRPVAADEERAFLALQPLGLLPLEREVARRLRLMGVKTLGHFMALPSNTLLDQFGRETMALYRLIKGEEQQPLTPAPPARELKCTHIFEPPLADGDTLGAVLGRMAAELADQLLEGEAVGHLLLRLTDEHGKSSQQTVSLRQPAATGKRIAAILEELMALIPLDAPVSHLAIMASDLAPATVQQLSLFGRARQSPQPQKDDTLLETIIARHRSGAFYRPALVNNAHPIPEARFCLHRLPSL